MGVLALIPARAGSKGVPGKNLRPLGGRPLIAYSIEHALRARAVERVVVSTDSEEIAAVARRFGAQTPFVRPAELAGDRVSDLPVVAHAVQALRELDGWQAELIVLLRPTTPLREPDLTDRCIARLEELRADSVRTVRDVGHAHPYWMLRVDKKGLSRPLLRGRSVDAYYQRQLLPPVYRHDGYCDVIRAANLPRRYSAHETIAGMYGTRRGVLIHDPEFLINIDSLQDFELAERALERRGSWSEPHAEHGTRGSR